MATTSDRPISVDGVRLDTLAWNVEKINRATAARRSGDYSIPNLDGALPSLNDPLEPASFGLEMWLRGTDADGAVPAEGSRTRLRTNLDELLHLFGKRHQLLTVTEQVGRRAPLTNRFRTPRWALTSGTVTVRNNYARNPRFATDLTGADTYSGTGALSRVTGVSHPASVPGAEAVRVTYAAGDFGAGVRVAADSTAGSGQQRWGSVWVRQVSGTPRPMSVAITGVVAGASFTPQVGTWVRGAVFLSSQGSATSVGVRMDGAAPDAGAFDVVGFLLEESNEILDYFDGSTATPTPELATPSWVGTPHLSASRLTAPNPVNVATSAQSVAWQVPDPGGAYVRLRTWSGSGNNGQNRMNLPWDGITSGAPFTLRMEVRATKASQWGLGQDGLSATIGGPFTATTDWAWVERQVTTVNGNAPYLLPWTDATAILEVRRVVVVDGIQSGVDYFDGSSTPEPLESYAWTGTPDNSASVRTPDIRRALAKVTDAIAPDLNTPGSQGRFSVAMTIPSGMWEDETAQTFTKTGAGIGSPLEVTTLRGATERVNDAALVVQGPATNPTVTDTATGMWVRLNRSLAAGERWRFNSATWSSRFGPTLTVDSADTDGTDQGDRTEVGGPSRAYGLPLTPTRASDGRRVVTVHLTTGIQTSTVLTIKARRKYAA